MSRQNKPGDGGPPVRRAVALPSVGDDAEQSLRPAPRRGTATTGAAAGTTGATAEVGTTAGATAVGRGRDETGPSSAAPASHEPEAREETAGPDTNRRERPGAAADSATPARTASPGGTRGPLSGLAAVLGGARRSGGAGQGSGDDDGAPGRPKAPMLAAAGIAGVVLIAVPLLVMAGDDRDEQTKNRTTVAADSRELGDGQEAQQPPDVYVAESPKDDTPAGPSKDRNADDAKGGKEQPKGEDGGTASEDGAAPVTAADDGAAPVTAADDGAPRPQAARQPEKGESPAKEAQKSEKKAQKSEKKAVAAVAVTSARIVSADTGKCLTATTRGAGAELVIQPCGASEGAQIWSFHDADRTLRVGGDLCMGLEGGSVKKETALRLQRCDGSAGQKFKINATEDLVSLKAGNMCADVWWGKEANGTPVKLWPCTGTANQTWRRG
ncbi:ricin-type beta-trefoil lectin domain protein [Streptomyces hirsutus]|uniref:ricin-type beta-trefoil lectin domain protein n=1 Tax=Streptomyces hirsutus TaxID=35620 RepID=UPI0036C82A99